MIVFQIRVAFLNFLKVLCRYEVGAISTQILPLDITSYIKSDF